MKKAHPGTLLLLLIIIMLAFTGCWGKVELSDQSIVTAVGIDINDDGSIMVTIMARHPHGPVNQPVQRSDAVILTTSGGDIADAMDNLDAISSRKITLVHNKLILVGSEAARTAMDMVIDYFSRSRESRYTSYLIIAEETAYDILNTPSILSNNISDKIEQLVRDSQTMSISYTTTLRNFLVASIRQESEAVTSIIKSEQKTGSFVSMPREDYMQLENPNASLPIAELDGCAVFKGITLAGKLNQEETKGLLWMTDKIMPGIIVNSYNEGKVSIEVTESKTSLRMNFENDSITASVTVKAKGRITEQSSSHDIGSAEVLKQIEQHMSEEIKKQMQSTVIKAQKDFETDIFGFGLHIYRKHPARWKELYTVWNSVYPDIKVVYDVSFTIERTGMILRTVLK